MDKEQKNELVWKFFIWVIATVSGLAISFSKMLWSEVNDIDGRLIVIESSRCDAARCNSIYTTVHGLEQTLANIPKEVPPKWFLDKVNRLESRIDLIERREWEGKGWRYKSELTDEKR